ncbi:MAG TPA: single-stranded-DNA-specific exonuclease RecJ, partial [Rhodanobacteraceae bacterium]|nr:single-stranded-DNA-specific exonuclease RecJ [Rhodanobacteraceae bacterium]
SASEIELRLAALTSPKTLGGLDCACELLASAIEEDQPILIAGDYDCDGATGVAVAVRGLRLLGARRLDYVVPDRFVHGYGLSPALIDSLAATPALIVTVDNGIASIAGVAAAKARGIRVLITDHHLPGETLPAADAIVNPRVRGEGLGNLAGVGVMFYLLLALRARLRQAGAYQLRPEPELAALLDLVALGTVADLVPLDHNNRILVEAGLRRIRGGRASAGLAALINAAGRHAASLTSTDIAFAVAPRVNAAGRLENMALGIECLLSDDAAHAGELAAILSTINSERRGLQASMLADAETALAHTNRDHRTGVVLFDAAWHAGVVGLVASKVKERLHRPVIAFAPANEGSAALRGSARSIPGFHIRDALATIDAAEPGLITRFGGHAMAAGLELPAASLARFAARFDQVARQGIAPEALAPVLWSDGELAPADFNLDLARLLRHAAPWGQGFPSPLFDNVFECVLQRPMGQGHRRLALRDPRDGHVHEAVMFNVEDDLPMQRPLRIAYELTVNDWQGRETPRLLLRHVDETL